MKTINNVLRAAIMVAVLPGPVFGQSSAPPVLVMDIAQGSASSTPRSFVVKEGVAYFAAKDADHGTELWRTDGTPSGTYMVLDIRPGPASSGPGDLWPDTPSSAPASLVEMGGYVYFVANDGVHGQELWRSDGTPGGTAMVLDALPGAAGSLPEHLTALGGTLFFKACHTSTGCELWKSDGTATGTSLVADIRIGSQSSFPQHFATLGGLVLFAANDNVVGEELWRSDGTAGGTVLLKNIDPTPLASPADGQGRSYPQWLTRVGDGVLFIARDATHGYELWRTDGTASGTAMLVDLSPGADSGAFSGGPSSPVQLVDDKLFFLGKTSNSGEESIVRTMVSDGTTAGTHQAGSYLNDGSRDRARLGSFYYFAEGSAADGAELWRADTSTLNAIPFASLAPGSASSSPKFFQTIGESVFFTASGAGLGEELWRTDGTAGGTLRLSDINPGSGSSSPSKVIQLGDVLLFTASDGATGVELWAFALNRAPIAQAGSDLELPEGATADLDGSTSTDPDADPLTFEWRDANDVVLGTEATLAVSLPNGVHDITLTVSDGQASAADTVRVTVGNTRPLGVTVVSFEDGVGSVDIDQPPGVCDGVAGGSTTCSSDAAFESIVTLTATPSPLSVFTGWSGACSGVSPSCTVTMSSAQNVTATFRGPQTLTIEAVSFENGIGEVFASNGGSMNLTCQGVAGSTGSCTVSVRVGDMISFYGMPGPLSVLNSISGCVADPFDPNGAGCFPPFEMTGPKTVSATFRGPQTLTIEAVSFENGIGEVFASNGSAMNLTCQGVAGSTGSCSVPVRVGDMISFYGMPGPLSVLNSISGCVADPFDPNGAGCFPPFEMTGPKTVSATFRGPQTLTIEAVSFENGIGEVFASNGGSMNLTCQGVAGSTGSCSVPVRVGDMISFYGMPGPLSVLNSISGCVADPFDPNGAGCFPPFEMIGPKTVSATFRGPQTLTIEAVSFENGIGEVFASNGSAMNLTCQGVAGSTGSCSVPVRVGDMISFYGMPGPLSVLNSISGCVADPFDPNGAGCFPPFEMTGPKTVSATFRGPQTLGVSFGGDGTGEVAVALVGACASAQGDCTFPIRVGATVELSANPSTDSLFQSWVGTCAGQGAVCSLTITDDVTTQAVFVLRNHPPVANAGGPYSGVRNQPIAFNGAASTDPEPDTLAYSWDFGDGSPAGTGVAPTHAYATTGTFTVTLTVNDGTVNSAPVTTTVTVVNQAPTANAGGPYAGVRNQAITFSGAASNDPDGDALTYSWDFGDGSPTGTGVAPTHAFATTGTFTVTVTVNDGTTTSTAATATVTISNQAPIANAGGPYSGVRNQAITFSGATSSDPDGDALTYSWDFGDGSPAGTGAAPTHAYPTTGTFTVTLTVNDGTTTSTAATATATISNQTPVANAGGPYSGVRNQAIMFSGAASNDPDGDALTYSWDFGDGSPAGTGAAPTHAYATTGTFTVTLTVNDGTTTSTAAAATVTISNQAPIANAGGPYTGTRLAAITFNGSASTDPDADSLIYSWNFGDGGTATGPAPSHLYTATGTFTVTLTVNDGTANSAPATSTVNITNVAPTVTLTSPSAGAVFHAPAAVAISAVAADSDGAVAKVEFFAGLTKVGEVLDTPYAIMWPATAPGTYSLTAVVTDSSGATVVSAPVAVVINAPPTVSITAPADNAQFAAPDSITVSAAATDADGSIAQVEFFRGATSLGVDSQSPYSVTWAGAPVGSYQLTAVATDNRGAVVTSTAVTVKVTATLAPTADSYVHASKSNSNFGTSTEVTVQQGSSNSNIRWTYMKFDLSTIPTITDARVRLFGRVSATTTTAINTAVYSVSDTSWTETGIKWSNKPATGTTALSTAAIVNDSTTARWYEFDVTAYLQAEKAAGRNVVTLAFKNLANSSPYVTFTSKEGTAANRPQVMVVP